MRRLALASLTLLLALPAHAGFLATLSPEKNRALGLDHLTPEQAAAIDAAIEDYLKPHTAAATRQAATAAVEEYKVKQQPGVIARAMNVFKQREEEDRVEKFATKIIGRFTGWGGHTLFALDNGQVWQQAGSEVYYTSPVENPESEIRKAPSGHFRLYLADGTWVTVNRVR